MSAFNFDFTPPPLPDGVTPDEAQDIAVRFELDGFEGMNKRELTILNLIRPKQVNACGDCTFCCRAPAIAAVKMRTGVTLPAKAAGDTCTHCSLKGGCGIYDDRPGVCMDYLCGYAMGWIPHKPEEVQVAWCPQMTPDEQPILVGHCMDVHAAIRDPRNAETMIAAINSGRFYAVTLRCHKTVLSFVYDEPRAYMADIDQTDPAKARIVAGSERPSPYRFA